MAIVNALNVVLTFQSAVAHELISNPTPKARRQKWSCWFQSAVAHELISNLEIYKASELKEAVSKRCRA